MSWQVWARGGVEEAGGESATRAEGAAGLVMDGVGRGMVERGVEGSIMGAGRGVSARVKGTKVRPTWGKGGDGLIRCNTWVVDWTWGRKEV